MTRSLLHVAATAALLALAAPDRPAASEVRKPPPFPTDPKSWIGPPQSLAGLRGQVILLDVWTFRCVNCRRTVPWVKEAIGKYQGRGLTVVGVHTPETEEERAKGSVEKAVRRENLSFSHFLDNDYEYWKALGNEYWPTLYLVDRCGRLRAQQIGEVHSDADSGRRVEAQIEKLLAEPAAPCEDAAS